MQPPPQSPGSFSTPQRSNPVFSSKAFQAADASEQRSVTLEKWWLEMVDGHEHKISVAGFYETNHGIQQFTAGLLAERREPCSLKTKDGILVILRGFFNSEKTLRNGFTIEACKKFSLGFPHWWENWNLLYPNMMSLKAGSQPRSSRTCNFHEDSNVPSASLVDSTNDVVEVVIDNALCRNEECQETIVNSIMRQASHGKTLSGEAHLTPSEKPVCPLRKQRSAFGKLQHMTRLPNIISPIPYGNLPPLTRGRAKSLSVSTPEYLKLKKTKSGRVVVPALNSGCQKIVYDADGSISAIVGLDSPPPLKATSTAPPNASPKRGHPQKQRNLNAPLSMTKLSSPRPRGCSPQVEGQQDALDAAGVQASADMPKAHGHQPKKPKASAPAPAPALVSDGSTRVKRGRGRPPKERE